MKNRLAPALFALVVTTLMAFLISSPASAVLPSGNGRQTMAKSVSVTMASDQAAIPVSGTITATVDTSLLATEATVATLKQPTATSAVTASDATALTCTKGLWVGTAGNLSLKLSGDSAAVTWKNVPSGTYVPGSVIRVMAATTAADVVCLQ